MKNIKSDLKIIVVGNTNTGKTSFVNKWTKNQYSDSYKATIVSEFGYKIFEKDNKVYRIQIWDLAGQDKNPTMTRVFCKDSHGVVVMCDVTDKTSLEATLKWKKSIDESTTFFDGTLMPMMIIQNKIDLIDNYLNSDDNDEIKQSLNNLKQFEVKNGFIMSYQTSVKKDFNVNESMNEFLNFIIEKTEKMSSKYNNASFTSQNDANNSIVLDLKDNNYKIKNSNCCSN